MKVLLFVQNDGDKRPKVRWAGKPWWLNCPDNALEGVADTAYVDAMAAARWWLVKAESADAGRMAIAHSVEPCRIHPSECWHCSGNTRILASGGKP